MSNTLATLRMVERAVVVLGGILSIYLGYRLFQSGITTLQGEAQAFGITLKSFAPGLFFAALGAYVLVTALKANIRTGDLAPTHSEQEIVQVDVSRDRSSVTGGMATTAMTARDGGTSTFFFGMEENRPDSSKWATKSFFLETRDLLRKLDDGRDSGETAALRETLKKKLSAITMTSKQYERYQILTNKVDQTQEEQSEYLALDAMLFP